MELINETEYDTNKVLSQIKAKTSNIKNKSQVFSLAF